MPAQAQAGTTPRPRTGFDANGWAGRQADRAYLQVLGSYLLEILAQGVHTEKIMMRRQSARRFLSMPVFGALVLAMGCGGGSLTSTSTSRMPQQNTVPAAFFGQNISDVSNYPSVPIGNMGKEIAAEWGYIEPDAPTGAGCPGTVNCTHTYNWSQLDSFVSTANFHRVQFMWTYDQSPPWAVSNVGCSGSPPQCSGPITDYPDFDAFIVALATRYNGTNGHGIINVYELNNEQDFSGTMTQLAMQSDHLVKDVHSINPTALIVGMAYGGPDTSYASGNLFDQFWTAWGAISGNVRHLDAVSFHGYPHGCCSPGGNPVPEIVAGSCVWDTGLGGSGFSDCVRQGATRNGISSTTPIWDTEGSWGLNTDVSLTTDQQVAFIGRFELLNWSAGVSRQNWYSWDNVEWGTLCTGGPPCTLNVPGVAYQQVISWMVGSAMTSPCTPLGTVYTCSLTLASGTQAIAVWDTAGNSSFTAPAGYMRYKDLAGNTTAISGPITIGIQPLLLLSATAHYLNPSSD